MYQYFVYLIIFLSTFIHVHAMEEQNLSDMNLYDLKQVLAQRELHPEHASDIQPNQELQIMCHICTTVQTKNQHLSKESKLSGINTSRHDKDFNISDATAASE